MKVVLETERLQLRELEPADLDFVAAMLANPDVNRYYEKQFTREDSEIWLNRQMERYHRYGHGLWLAQKRTGEPVGQIGLTIQLVEGRNRPEVGWLLHRPHWGHGYATEAGRACRDAAFGRWGYLELISLIRPGNEASQRVALRLGLEPGELVQFHGFPHIVFRVTRPAEGGLVDRGGGRAGRRSSAS
jgi:RimJ/RimL family protein N-acetyltransferase